MKLHIEFSVREPESERYITFADDVPLGQIRDWFVRASLGIEQLFDIAGAPRGILMVEERGLKIMAIKLVRELTGCGLREAKDAVDSAATATPFMICEDGRDVASVIGRFSMEGIKVEDVRIDDMATLVNGKHQRMRPLRGPR